MGEHGANKSVATSRRSATISSSEGTQSPPMMALDPLQVISDAGFKIPASCDTCRSYAGEKYEDSCDYEDTRFRGGNPRCTSCSEKRLKCENRGERSLKSGRLFTARETSKVHVRQPKKWIYPLAGDLEFWKNVVKNPECAGPGTYFLRETTEEESLGTVMRHIYRKRNDTFDPDEGSAGPSKRTRREGTPEVVVKEVKPFRRSRHAEGSLPPNKSPESKTGTGDISKHVEGKRENQRREKSRKNPTAADKGKSKASQDDADPNSAMNTDELEAFIVSERRLLESHKEYRNICQKKIEQSQETLDILLSMQSARVPSRNDGFDPGLLLHRMQNRNK